jgi:hypothetical protein
LLKPGKELTASFIEAEWKRGQDDLKAEILRMQVIQSLMSGDEWVSFNRETGTLQTDSSPTMVDDAGRLRIPINRMRPALRRQVAKITAKPLRFSVVPSGSSNSSIDGAKKSEAALNDVVRRHDWDKLREDAAWHTPKSGTCVFAIEWDPQTKDTYECMLSVAEVAFEPATRNARESYWWIKAQAIPVSEVQRIWQMPVEPRANTTASAQPLFRMIRGEQRHAHRAEKLALVLTYYERPNYLRPEGAMVVVIDGKVVSQGPWPFPFTDHLNVAVVRMMPSDARWTGETPFTDAAPLQQAMSMGVSAALENLRAYPAAKMAVKDEDRSILDNMDDDPMVPIVYSGDRPGFVEPPQMPPWHSQLREEIRAEIDQVLGDSDPLRGNSSGSITSGSGIALLVEQADAPLGMLANSIAAAFSELGNMCLQILAQQYQTEEQVAEVYQSNGLPPARVEWSGAALNGEFNAQVAREAILPRSQLASWELAKEMKSMFPDLPFEKFLELADYGNLSNVTQHLNPDVAKQRRENHGIMTAPLNTPDSMPIPEKFDDHRTHIAVINEWRKSPEYERMEDWRKTIAEYHALIHQQFAMEEAIQQAGLAMPMPMTGQPDAMMAAIAGAAQANEPPSPDELLAPTPGAVAPEGGVGPVPQMPAGEYQQTLPTDTP